MGIARLYLAASILAASGGAAAAVEMVRPFEVLEQSRRDRIELDKRLKRDAIERQKQEREQAAQRKRQEAEQRRREKEQKAQLEAQRKRPSKGKEESAFPASATPSLSQPATGSSDLRGEARQP